LEYFVDILPLGEKTTSTAFTGFALNIGVQTKPHLDKKDMRKFCMVIVLGDGDGGDLCFHELGIRITARPGDVIAFMSGWLTHFNTPFQGRRVSIVNYTEHSMSSWGEKGNGWMQFF
jgi:hypothetical protein